MSHPYTRMFKTWIGDFQSYFFKTFLQDGKTGFAKLALASVLALWGLHFVARNNGLLPKKSIKNSHIFITGAASGIGRQMAIRFAELGAKVSIADINIKAAEEVESILRKRGLQAKAIYCDVTSTHSVKEAAGIARETFGEVEILINNAGIVSGKKLLENSEKMIEKTYQVNTISHAYTVREFLPHMIKQNKGHIVTIASMAGTFGVCGLADYCASKFGAFGFDESLRMELRHSGSKVKTTCICPSYINTGMFDGVKMKMPLVFPLLSEEYASKRIVNAILQEEKVTIFPFACNFIFYLRAFLPIWLFDTVCDITGANSSMETFVGRVNLTQK